MMSVYEYASDMNRTVDEILNLCQKLGIKVSNKDDELSDDDIILLDNEIENTESINDEEETVDGDNLLDFDDSYEEDLEEVKVVNTVKKKKKNPKKEDKNDNENFAKQKKEMYKHKDKLISNINTDDDTIVLYTEGMSVSEFANVLNKNVAEIIKKLMGLGKLMNLNAMIDFETAEILALEYGKTLKKDSTRDETNFEELEIIDDEKDLQERPPVITIMGHVDHGKTSLLDAIRKTNVVSGEAGGITQHIGAYQINYNGKPITFIDTPGHAAFTEMRARGASITDIVIIIVAADDGVMPQTLEAISHAKDAKVPIIVAVNKIDKPEANPDLVKTQLSDKGLTPEEWGGDTQYVHISALKGEGIDDLLNAILLQAEMLELKANNQCRAEGKILESRVEHGRGIVSSVIVQRGTLRKGDPFVAGIYSGKVRAMSDDRGREILEAGPSTPVEVLGMSDVPNAGDPFQVTKTIKDATDISEKRQELKRNEAAKAGYMADAHKATGSFVIKTGHGVPINDKTKALRADIGLPELPPTVHAFPEALEEVQKICAACEFDKLIGFNMEKGELE